MPPAKKRGRPKKPKKKILLHKLQKSSDQNHLSHLFPHLISTLSSTLSFLRHHDLLLSPHQTLLIESHLSSSSLSLSSLLSLLSLPPPPPPPPLPLPSPPNPHSWFHRFLSQTPSTFKPIKPHQDSQTNQDSTFLLPNSSTLQLSSPKPIKPHQDSTFLPQTNQDSNFLLPNSSALQLPSLKSIKTNQDSNFPPQTNQDSNFAPQTNQDSNFSPQTNEDSSFFLPNSSRLHLSSPKPIKPHQDSSFHPQNNRDSEFSLWVDFFNVSQASFNILLQLLTPSLSSLLPVQPNYALAATLYRLAHAVSFSVMGRRFEMDAATACRAFYTVVKAINENLGHLFEFQEDISRVIVGFGWISLPNCCGVLGFERFGVDREVLGENGSLLVQGLVDSEGRFLDVSAGWPSTLTAESILRKSMLFSGVEESKDYLNGSSYNLSDGHSIPQYILGESSFPLLPWLLTPYRRSNENVELSETEMVFNSVHFKGIELVRKAFAKVKLRWKLVAKNSKEQCVEAFPDVIVACCLLHNFLIKSGDEGQLVDENVEISGEQFFPAFKGDGETDGEKVRDALALHLCRVSQRR